MGSESGIGRSPLAVCDFFLFAVMIKEMPLPKLVPGGDRCIMGRVANLKAKHGGDVSRHALATF